MPGVDDAAAFREMAAAMAAVGMGADEREAAFRAVAGLLHLGNAKFVGEDQAPTELRALTLLYALTLPHALTLLYAVTLPRTLTSLHAFTWLHHLSRQRPTPRPRQRWFPCAYCSALTQWRPRCAAAR